MKIQPPKERWHFMHPRISPWIFLLLVQTLTIPVTSTQ